MENEEIDSIASANEAVTKQPMCGLIPKEEEGLTDEELDQLYCQDRHYGVFKEAISQSVDIANANLFGHGIAILSTTDDMQIMVAIDVHMTPVKNPATIESSKRGEKILNTMDEWKQYLCVNYWQWHQRQILLQGARLLDSQRHVRETDGSLVHAHVIGGSVRFFRAKSSEHKAAQ